MKVWAVEGGYGSSKLFGVYSTKEKAEERAKSLMSRRYGKIKWKREAKGRDVWYGNGMKASMMVTAGIVDEHLRF